MLRITDIQRVATEVAARRNPDLKVIAVTRTGSDSAYAEVVVKILGCAEEPCQLMIGLSRDASESTVRHTFETELSQHLEKHP
jgi:hypothetical protein